MPFRHEPRCCAKLRHARRGMQVMVVPLPNPATPHGAICRATRRDGPVFAWYVVTRRLIWATKLRVSRLAHAKTGSVAAVRETATDPRDGMRQAETESPALEAGLSGVPRHVGTCRNKGLVGETGFEPATFSSRTRRATKLRYTPNEPYSTEKLLLHKGLA